MSLSGSIADLPLLDILQVVAFSKRTGHLTVGTGEGEAAVAFRDGRVISGYTWDLPPLGDEEDRLTPEARTSLLRARLAHILSRLVRLREGRFAFSLATEAPARLGDRDLSRETLEEGINPEELMLDLARQLDEDRRDCAAALTASFATTPDTEALLEDLPLLEEKEARKSTVLLVDDEPDVRRVVSERLSSAGFRVTVAADAADAAREAARLTREGESLLVVTDLGLPSAQGSSFRGGLDVVKGVAGLSPKPPMLLMSETIDGQIRSRARRLGASMLAFKPGLSKLDPLQYEADLRAFGDTLARSLLPHLEGGRARPAPLAASPSAKETADRAGVVRSALDQISQHADPDHIAFLLLSVARAFFPRAILFIARDDMLRGLAGFGPTQSGASLDLLARELAVPLDEPSAFSHALSSGRPWSGPLPRNGPTRRLLDHVGPLGVAAASLVPVRAHQETIAVLYGDIPGGAAPPPLEPLFAFVETASRALEGAFIARRGAAAP